jgi:hypothetical protein
MEKPQSGDPIVPTRANKPEQLNIYEDITVPGSWVYEMAKRDNIGTAYCPYCQVTVGPKRSVDGVTYCPLCYEEIYAGSD